jgi:hypothetical protein
MDQAPVRRATWRLDARMRFRLQWAVIAMICTLLVFALKPAFIHVRETRDLQVCENNMRKISQALKMYMGDWEGALPPGSTWMYNVQGNLAATSNTGFSVSTYFHCPLDHSGGASSYCYNDLLEGVAPGIAAEENSDKETRRMQVRNAFKIPIILEKHGSPENAHVRLLGFDDLAANITTVHELPEPTAVIMTGNGGVERITQERLMNSKGKKF